MYNLGLTYLLYYKDLYIYLYTIIYETLYIYQEMQGEFNTKCQTVINCAEEGNVIVGEY